MDYITGALQCSKRGFYFREFNFQAVNFNFPSQFIFASFSQHETSSSLHPNSDPDNLLLSQRRILF